MNTNGTALARVAEASRGAARPSADTPCPATSAISSALPRPARQYAAASEVSIGLAVLGYILKDAFVPLPAAPFSWDALAAGITLAAGIVLPSAYPPVRRGIVNSPLLKAGASALLGTRPASE
jgi:hypothetical protein